MGHEFGKVRQEDFYESKAAPNYKAGTNPDDWARIISLNKPARNWRVSQIYYPLFEEIQSPGSKWTQVWGQLKAAASPPGEEMGVMTQKPSPAAPQGGLFVFRNAWTHYSSCFSSKLHASTDTAWFAGFVCFSFFKLEGGIKEEQREREEERERMCDLPAFMSLHQVKCSDCPEEGVGSPRTRVIASCEPLGVEDPTLILCKSNKSP